MFGKTTVDSIIAGFTKTVNQLDTLISDEQGLNSRRAEDIVGIRKAMSNSDIEIERATSIRTNINNILS